MAEVRIYEVGPRDGLQNEAEVVATDAKLELVRRLIDAGVCVTLNTDDTFLFGNSLAEEYYALVQELGFSRAELIELARNGVKSSMLETSQRAKIEAELNALAAALTPSALC